jgi:hypothetical protein
MHSPDPSKTKPQNDQERVAAQRARFAQRKKKQASRPATEPIVLARGEWGAIRSGTHPGAKVVR